MSGALDGKVAIVTGAAQGIGAAYAGRLAALGAAVVVADLNEEGGHKTAQALVADGHRATFSYADVADEASVAALVAGAVDTYGGLDILVNNAAIYQGIRQSAVEELDVDYWRRVMDVNVTGVFIASRAAIPAMKARGGGVIVNQASTGAFMNAPTLVHYAVSKAAVVAFTRNLATEVGPANIRVNAIAPGFTLSEATLGNFPESYHAVAAGGSALGRNGLPEDLCGTLEYLVTDASAWMTGQTLVVDGGKGLPALTVTLDPASILPTGLLIGDTWLDRSSGGEMEHVYAGTGEVQRVFPVAGPAEVDAAVAVARAALPAWAATAPADRRAVLLRLAAALRARADDFAAISILETGMIRPAANSMAPVAADWFEYYAGWADKLSGEHIRIPGAFDYTIPEPVGVAAVLFTWNGPTASLGMKLAPALAAGCVVVLKPPELAPFSSNLFARLALEAGLPAGVLNVTPGGPEAGEALVRHPGVDKISFTGGRATAARIQAACAETLTPLLLELGGKSANIVFDDANLIAAATASAVRVVGMTGQTCVAPTRLLVQSSVYEEVVERVLGIMGSVRIGDPLAPETTMGPVISAAARDRIAATVADAADRGDGKLLLGGDPLPSGLPGGFYVAPAAFGDVDNTSALACNEIFGPVLSILRFHTEEEAVILANDTPYGLAAYLHTTDLARAHRVAAALDAGNVAVNGGAPMAGPYAPFGGFKGSGHGKEGALAGLLEFVRVKNVNINLG